MDGCGRLSRALLCDTRQKPGKHCAKEEWWESNGVPTVRSKVPFGDYCLAPARSVDTKRSIYELAQDIDQEHDRFRRELIAARDAECELTILVENDEGVRSITDLAEWSEPTWHLEMRKKMSGNKKTRRIEGSRLAKACATMEQRYGARFEFCGAEEAAEAIVEILGE